MKKLLFLLTILLFSINPLAQAELSRSDSERHFAVISAHTLQTINLAQQTEYGLEVNFFYNEVKNSLAFKKNQPYQLYLLIQPESKMETRIAESKGAKEKNTSRFYFTKASKIELEIKRAGYSRFFTSPYNLYLNSPDFTYYLGENVKRELRNADEVFLTVTLKEKNQESVERRFEIPLEILKEWKYILNADMQQEKAKYAS